MTRSLRRLSVLAVFILGIPAAAFAQLPFSYIVTPPAGAKIKVPNSEIHANPAGPGQPRPGHNWFVLAAGTGSMTITLANGSTDGVRATIFDATNTQVASINTIFGLLNSYPNEVRASTTFAATAGMQYRVQVDAFGVPGPGFCACPNYFLELDGAIEAGMSTPTAFNMISVAGPPEGDHGPGGSVNWRLNVGPGESLDLSFAPTGNGSTAPNLRVVLIDATDHVRLDERYAPPVSGALPRAIHIPDAGTTPGAWTMAIWGDEGPFPNGPYRILRQSGADRAVYVAWDTDGQGGLDVSVVQGAAPSMTPFLLPLDVLVTDIGGFSEIHTSVGGHVGDLDNSVCPRKPPPRPPAGGTAAPADLDLPVTYAATVFQTIRLQDLTPPTLSLPENLFAAATSAAGAVVAFEASGTDLDVTTVSAPVTCSNPSGSAFPMGVTVVTCTATDARGNTTSGEFTVTVFAASGAGGFVIGDLNATVGAEVTFWGAQWSQVNAVSGGAPSSFKGFANASSSAPAAIGGNWTTDPGNSSQPPNTVASYIAVMVSSTVTKSGSTISGNVVAIAIVRTDAGYAGNPGHAGTGTVIAVIR